MKNGKPSQNGKEELRKAKNQNRMSRKSSNSKTQKLPLNQLPLTLSMQALPQLPLTLLMQALPLR
jgi:hypothetical protein